VKNPFPRRVANTQSEGIVVVAVVVVWVCVGKPFSRRGGK
jgi:hypothetical protein